MVNLKFDFPKLDDLTRLEWLVTNGIGGFASGTVSGVLTRRYHGLLVASLQPPVDRVNTVVKLDEWVQVGKNTYLLFANQWFSSEDDLVPPNGCKTLINFFHDGQIPTWHYQWGNTLFEKKVWMEQGSNTTYVRYQNLEGEEEIRLTLKGMLSYTNFHHTNHREADYLVEKGEDGVGVFAGEGCEPYYLFAPEAEFKLQSIWMEKFFLGMEAYRGLDAHTDLFNGVDIIRTLNPGESMLVTLTTDPSVITGDQEALSRRKEYEAGIFKKWPFGSGPSWADQLPLSADQFIVSRDVEGESGHSIMAGYHWFSDWGRDTMIALPGLTLATGRYEIAESILRTFGMFLNDGMLPNRFPDLGEEPVYNTIDATLWYFEAIYQYFLKMNPVDPQKARKLVEDLFPKLEEIISHHEKGTRYQIHMDPSDGLIYGGEEGTQLTWMDAKVENFVVTPRIGKPVEINGLWYSALRIMAEFADLLGQSADPFMDRADQVRVSFQKFWNPAAAYCFDVIDGPGGNDASLRPNQVLAASVAFPPLDSEQIRSILKVSEEKLVTKFGLRSLGREEEGYVPVYSGDIWQRDSGYHQGTVWGWLMGPFLVADYRLNRDKEKVMAYLREFCTEMNVYGLGSISEIFDAEPPHTSRGCIAQAWSVAAVLWALDQIEEE